MESAEAGRAVTAAMSVASGRGIRADRAVVLNDSNRLVVRLLPGDVVARIASMRHPFSAEHEVEMVHRLGSTDAPVVGLADGVGPRVYVEDGFRITFWTHARPRTPPRVLPPDEYGHALDRLHAGLREIEIEAGMPHVVNRV